MYCQIYDEIPCKVIKKEKSRAVKEEERKAAIRQKTILEADNVEYARKVEKINRELGRVSSAELDKPTLKAIALAVAVPPNVKLSVKFMAPLMNDAYVGEFESSSYKRARVFKNIMLRIRCYPAGDREFNRGFISVHIDFTSTTREEESLKLSFQVDGDPEIRTYNVIAVDGVSFSIQRFISHDDVRSKKLLFDGFLTFSCTVDNGGVIVYHETTVEL
uniref:MATH domain-containing protein n=1 Tax=Panagrellus redivivus TaxID=6233 RepID=A0A7E4VYX6_PANRE